MKQFTPRDLLNCACGRSFGVSIIDIRLASEFQRSHIICTYFNFDYNVFVTQLNPTKDEIRSKLLGIQKVKSSINSFCSILIFLGGGFFFFFLE
jgi:rhodanese-related sulfurtransferase